ncbi:MAG: PQQ-binding-like beta-propeller repeat protein [Gammaproteobacteria bacterium]|nr:PQQ-binding-like beta-propeller repeat protein [Gammaproteobacteria bacterium]
MISDSSLVVGIKGHVVCIRKSDGRELWRTHLRGSDTTSVVRDEDTVFAATNGYVYALNVSDGAIRWVNNLPRLGYGACTMGSPNQGALAALQIIAQQQAAMLAAITASSGAVAAASS